VTTILLVIFLPLVFALVCLYAVVRFAVFVLWIAFAPIVWLSNRPTRQRVELRHYHGDLARRESLARDEGFYRWR
jgi:hypothetical protein